MNQLLYSLLSGLIGAVLVSLWQGRFIRMQIGASKEQHRDLLTRMLDERNLLNERLGQISSATDNIAHYLSGRRDRNDDPQPIGWTVANHFFQ